MLKTMGVNQKLPTFVLLFHLIMQLTETYRHETELTMAVEKPGKMFEEVQENLKTAENSSLKTIFIVEAAPDVIEEILSNLTKEMSGENIKQITENGSNKMRNKREDEKLTLVSESLENLDRIGFLGNYELQKINVTKTENGANRALNDPKKSKLIRKTVPLISNQQSTFRDETTETTPLLQNKSRGNNRRQRNHIRKVNLLTRGMNKNFIPVQTQVPQITTFSSTPQVDNLSTTKFQRRSFDVAPEDISGKIAKRNSGFEPFPTLPYSSFTNRPSVVTNPGIYHNIPATFNPRNYHSSSTHRTNFLDQKLLPTDTQNYDVTQYEYSTGKPVFEILAKYDKMPRPFAKKLNSRSGELIEHVGTQKDPIYQGSQYNVPATLSPNNFHTTNFSPNVHQYPAKSIDISPRKPPASIPERNYNDYNSFFQRTLTPQSSYAINPPPVNNYSGPTRPPYQEYDYNSNNYDFQQVPRKPQKGKKSSKVEGHVKNQFVAYNPNKGVDKKYTESKKLQSVSVINPYKVVEDPEEGFNAYETATVGRNNGFELKNPPPTKNDYNYEVTERSFDDFAPTTLFPFKAVAEQSSKLNSKANEVYPKNIGKESDHELNSHRDEYTEDESEERKSNINSENEDDYDFGEKISERDEETGTVTDNSSEPSDTKLTAGSEVKKVIVLDQEKEGSDHEQKGHEEPKKDEKFEEEGGEEHGQEHHEEESESGEKFYDSKHEHEKGEKGHHDKEDHTHHYNEEEGHQTDSEGKGEYEKLYHKEEEGDKETTFDEKGEHNKGHSTKGQHVIHKNDEFEKETEFFDEFIEEDGDEKDGAYHHEHHNEKGGDYKSGHHLSELGEEKHGKGGQFAKGHNHHEDEGHKQDEAHDQYHQHEQKYGNKGEDSDNKTWQHKKGK